MFWDHLHPSSKYHFHVAEGIWSILSGEGVLSNTWKKDEYLLAPLDCKDFFEHDMDVGDIQRTKIEREDNDFKEQGSHHDMLL